MSFKITRLKVFAMVLVLVGAAMGTTKQGTPPGRLTVAVLWFEDKTGDQEAAHWRYAIEGFLSNQFGEIKAVRLRSGVEFARRHLGINKNVALDASQARRIGELIEAQRVIWGSYRRRGDKWQVSAHVLNVASGKVSAELKAVSADWFELRDELTRQILRELSITPSDEERQKMARRSTTSPAALEWHSKAYQLYREQKPFSQTEDYERKAIAADPQFAKAYIGLASTLGTQGKFAEAEEAVRQALKLEPDSAYAHQVLGILLGLQKRYGEAEQELLEAHRLDPDISEPLSRLGQLCTMRNEWDEAIAFFEKARLLDPTNAEIHASLARAYAFKRQRDKAMVELKEAERLLDPENMNAEQMICQVYELLGEIPLAVEHYEKFVTLARKRGLDPEAISAFEETARRLKATLTPNFIEASVPKVYTEQALQKALRERLTKDELEMVINPVASSPEMKRWAEQLTKGGRSDRDKAKALFDGLTRRIEIEGGRGTRTAQEVFAAWSDPEESFSCQEYAKLFVALARDVKVKAFYVHIDKDYRGKVVPHDCTAVFADGRGLLIDPTYRWFGVPHKEFVILDDLQTIAHHLSQYTHTRQDVSRCRLAAKLHPDSAWGQLRLMQALCSAGQWEEGRKALSFIFIILC